MADEEAKIEEIKRRKREQMLQAQVRAEEEEERKRKIEDTKQTIIRRILTSEARERLNSIKMARPEFAEQIENQLIALVQSGRIKGIINDTKFKDILRQMTPKKREITIKRI